MRYRQVMYWYGWFGINDQPTRASTTQKDPWENLVCYNLSPILISFLYAPSHHMRDSHPFPTRASKG